MAIFSCLIILIFLIKILFFSAASTETTNVLGTNQIDSISPVAVSMAEQKSTVPTSNQCGTKLFGFKTSIINHFSEYDLGLNSDQNHQRKWGQFYVAYSPSLKTCVGGYSGSAYHALPYNQDPSGNGGFWTDYYSVTTINNGQGVLPDSAQPSTLSEYMTLFQKISDGQTVYSMN